MVLTKDILERNGFNYDEDFDRYTKVISEYNENNEYRCKEFNVYFKERTLVEAIKGREIVRLYCSSVERLNIIASLIGIRIDIMPA